VSRAGPRIGTMAGTAALALLAFGCANNDAVVGVTVIPPAGAQVSLAKNVQPIFNTSCAIGGCHAAPVFAPMSLEAGQALGNLVGVASCEAPGVKRVEPAASSLSYLITKLEGTQSALVNAGACTGCPNFTPSGNCGSQMPFGQTPLSAGEIQIIRDWIDQGAKDN
jgi:hypothetical protein